MTSVYQEIVYQRERDRIAREETKKSAEETRNKIREAFGSHEKVRASLRKDFPRAGDRRNLASSSE